MKNAKKSMSKKSATRNVPMKLDNTLTEGKVKTIQDCNTMYRMLRTTGFGHFVTTSLALSVLGCYFFGPTTA